MKTRQMLAAVAGRLRGMSRASKLAGGALVFLVSVLGLYVAWQELRTISVADQREATTFQQEQAQRARESELAAGEPVTLAPGSSYYGPEAYALLDPLPDLDGVAFDDGAAGIWDPSVPGWAWLQEGPENWVGVGQGGVSVVVEGKHPATVLVQGVELRDRKCEAPISGTRFLPPTIGSGGEGAPPVFLGLDVESSRPVPRTYEDARVVEKGMNRGVLGEPWTEYVALEQGDARTFDIRFEAWTMHCLFEVDLVVYSQGETYEIPIPSEWRDGVASDYTFEVTAPADSYRVAYRTAGSFGSSVIQKIAQSDES
ncbi:hypothetical protein [Promicromonospora soli]